MEPFFIGEVCMFAGNFAPRNWALCQGQLLSISENDALFSILGTTYGGDGRTTFGLPDFRGRIPVGQGTGPGLGDVRLGEKSGAVATLLNQSTMPNHTHTATATVGVTSASGDTNNPGAAVPATSPDNVYGLPSAAGGQLAGVSGTSNLTGSSQAFNKQMPSLGLHFIIALFGVYPSRS